MFTQWAIYFLLLSALKRIPISYGNVYCSSSTQIEPSLYDIIDSVVPLSYLSSLSPSSIKSPKSNELHTILYHGISDIISSILSIQLPIRTLLSNGVYSIDLSPKSPHYYDFSFKDVYLVQKQSFILDTICSIASSSGVFEFLGSDSDGNVVQSLLCGCNGFFHSYSEFKSDSNIFHSNTNDFEMLSSDSIKHIPGYLNLFNQLHSNGNFSICVTKRPVCTSKHSDRICQVKVDSLVNSCIWIKEGVIPSSNISKIISYNLSMPTLGDQLQWNYKMSWKSSTDGDDNYMHKFSILYHQLYDGDISITKINDFIIELSLMLLQTVILFVGVISIHFIGSLLGSLFYLFAESIASSKMVQFLSVLLIGPLLIIVAAGSVIYRYVYILIIIITLLYFKWIYICIYINFYVYQYQSMSLTYLLTYTYTLYSYCFYRFILRIGSRVIPSFPLFFNTALFCAYVTMEKPIFIILFKLLYVAGTILYTNTTTATATDYPNWFAIFIFLTIPIMVSGISIFYFSTSKGNVLVEGTVYDIVQLISIAMLLRSLSNRPLSIFITLLFISSSFWIPIYNHIYFYVSELLFSPRRQQFNSFRSLFTQKSNHVPSDEAVHQRVRQHTERELAKLRRFIIDNKDDLNDRFMLSPSQGLIDRFADGDYSGLPFRPPSPSSQLPITSTSQVDTAFGEDSNVNESSVYFNFTSINTWLSVAILLVAIYVIYKY